MKTTYVISKYKLITATAHQIATHLKKRDIVVVFCGMGLNRSALVAALALLYTQDVSAEEVIRSIRAARGPMALSNHSFVELIRREGQSK